MEGGGGGVARYWKRRGYGRVYGSGRRRMNRAKLGQGGGGGRRKRSWGIKIARKLRLILSPKKLLIKLRDAYVNFMLRLDDSNFMMMNRSGYGDAPSFGGGGGFGKGQLKEYDDKMIVQMYKSMLMAQGVLMAPCDPTARAVTHVGNLRTVKL